MLRILENKGCMGCSACASQCPARCITMEADAEGFLHPRVDASRCLSCNLCEKVCPVIHPLPTNDFPEAYAAINLDREIHMQSSSGGIFSLIAMHFINNGGVVFGVGWDSEFNAIHMAAHIKEELSALRGSKYVQSRIGNAYIEAKELLEKGVPVYFTGTPCQIQGFKKFLNKDYPHLMLQDIICHGVPAPKAFRKYVEHQCKTLGAIPTKISFREKEQSGQAYCISFSFENRACYRCVSGKDPYMKAFLREYTLRPSCYECKFKGIERVSDFTLADYWGIEHVHPDFLRDGGVSLVFVHSEKGKKLWRELKEELCAMETDAKQAVLYNPSAVRSAKKPANRDSFMKALDHMPFPKVVDKYCRDSLVLRAKRKIKAIVKKILH